MISAIVTSASQLYVQLIQVVFMLHGLAWRQGSRSVWRSRDAACQLQRSLSWLLALPQLTGQAAAQLWAFLPLPALLLLHPSTDALSASWVSLPLKLRFRRQTQSLPALPAHRATRIRSRSGRGMRFEFSKISHSTSHGTYLQRFFTSCGKMIVSQFKIKLTWEA